VYVVFNTYSYRRQKVWSKDWTAGHVLLLWKEPRNWRENG